LRSRRRKKGRMKKVHTDRPYNVNGVLYLSRRKSPIPAGDVEVDVPHLIEK
jgi:hypothetical protein